MCKWKININILKEILVGYYLIIGYFWKLMMIGFYFMNVLILFLFIFLIWKSFIKLE